MTLANFMFICTLFIILIRLNVEHIATIKAIRLLSRIINKKINEDTIIVEEIALLYDKIDASMFSILKRVFCITCWTVFDFYPWLKEEKQK